jgi:hypothetical protein
LTLLFPSTGEVRNNIFYNARNCYFGLDKYHYESGNNLLFNSDPYKKYEQDSFPNDIVNLDPLFIDIDSNDFSLHPNSPAVDRGTDLDFGHDFAGNKRPYGQGWDIGPYEYQGNSLPVAYIRFSNVLHSTTGHEPLTTRVGINMPSRTMVQLSQHISTVLNTPALNARER